MAYAINLKDDFEDNSFDTGIWVANMQNGASYAETGGQLTFTVSSVGHIAIVDAATTYDLTGSSIFVRGTLVTAPNTVSGIGFAVSAGNYALFFNQNGTVYCMYVVSDAQNFAGNFSYNSTTHKYLRIREAGGTMYYDTSSDGVTWTNRGSVSNPWTITSITPRLVTYCSGAPGGSFTAYHDSFNMIGNFKEYNGVTWGSIDKINGVSRATIGKVNGVPV